MDTTARALGYDIFTQGDNWDDLKAMARDAVRCYFRGSQCTQGDLAPPRQGRGHRGVKLPRNLSGEVRT